MDNKPADAVKPINKSLVVAISSLVVFLLMAGFALGYYYFSVIKKPSGKTSNTKRVEPTNSPEITKSIESQNLFSGKVRKLDEDLKLIIQTEDEKLNNVHPQVSYYEAGKYLRGKYKDYTRYVVTREAVDPSGVAVYIFASKDNQTYVLDGKPMEISSIKDDPNNYDNPLREIDRSKITKIDLLDTDQNSLLPLDDKFALNKNRMLVETVDGGKKDDHGNIQYEDRLITDFSGYKTLNSPFSNLTLYQYRQTGQTKKSDDMDKYTDGTTGVIAADSTGLAYLYDLSTKDKINKYSVEYDDYLKKVQEYNDSSAKDKVYPTYVSPPNLSLNKSDIQTDQTVYQKYNVALPQSCSSDVNTLIAKNISENDLKKIGTSPVGDIYTLTDKNHPLIKLAFTNKTLYDDKTFEEINNGKKKPTLDEYFASHPLIFFKDYWGRYVILGEYDWLLMGGCGKPVIYLYPTKPTTISLRFMTPIKLDINIPTYNNGWKVLANPDGGLTDLQTQFTDCNLIDSTKFGSEYAFDSCINNNYPYIYWSGQSVGKIYPAMTKGWIVAEKDLGNFLNDKLDFIRFNGKEKKDFLEYWLPELKSKNAQYFRISFLQNEEMNRIAPMQIIPSPKSYYRYFLDYQTFDSKPDLQIAPQELNKIVRDGFTYVEWGGLK